MDIREAGPVDAAIISSLVRESHLDVAVRFGLTPLNCPRHPSNCTQEWIHKDLARGVDYFILYQDERPAGCVAMERAAPEACYLERLSVLPSYRRNGFGRALVNTILKKAEAIGLQEVAIGIIALNTELKAWYEEIGFVEGETKEIPHLPFRVTFMAYGL